MKLPEENFTLVEMIRRLYRQCSGKSEDYRDRNGDSGQENSGKKVLEGLYRAEKGYGPDESGTCAEKSSVRSGREQQGMENVPCCKKGPFTS